jgi:hypothetical protein
MNNKRKYQGDFDTFEKIDNVCFQRHFKVDLDAY